MSDRDQAGAHPAFAAIAATFIVIAILGGYVWYNTKPPVHAGQLVSITAYPIHRELSTGSALGGLAGQKDIYDEEIVVANVHIKSQTEMPLFLHDMWADVTLADGTTQRSSGASPSDYHNVFIAYPTLAPKQTSPVLRDTTMTPGQTLDGQIIFHYPISGQQWDQRKDFKISVQFLHQKDLELDEAPTAAPKT
ncbi:MAG TPA: hypothetical protein VK819_11025 [Acidobacteriaceae bacterium]|jgi:hypothetical protein|nr:hypothetical protein [Acidobacteriaceae bacterium]